MLRFAALLVVVVAFQNANAQGCCGASASSASGLSPVLHKGEIMLRSGADFSKASNPQRESYSTSLGITYGLLDRLTVSVKSNYSWRYLTRERPAVISNGVELSPAVTIYQDNHDFGDGTIAAQYAILPMDWPRRFELLTGIDLLVPWGEDAKFSNGLQLPDNIQTGSGGYATSLFAGFSRSFPENKVAFSTVVSHRIKFKTRRGSDPGDESFALLSMAVGPVKSFSVTLPVSYRNTTASYSKFGVKEVATAGSRLDFVPGLEWAMTPHWKFTSDVDLPVWRDKNQKLYGNSLAVSFNASVLIF